MTIRVTVERFAGAAMHRQHIAHIKLTPIESGLADPRLVSWLVEAESDGSPTAHTIVRGFDGSTHSMLDLVRRALAALEDAPIMKASTGRKDPTP